MYFLQVLGPPCSSRDGVLGDCRPLIKCVRFLFEIETLRALPCQLPFGQPGGISGTIIRQNTEGRTEENPSMEQCCGSK